MHPMYQSGLDLHVLIYFLHRRYNVVYQYDMLSDLSLEVERENIKGHSERSEESMIH